MRRFRTETQSEERERPDWRIAAVYTLTAMMLAFGGWVSYTSWPVRDHGVEAGDTLPNVEPSSDPTAESQAPQDEESQATTMGEMLTTTIDGRSSLPSTLGNCATAASDLGTIQQVVADRDDQIAQARNLSVDEMESGPALQQSLVNMAQASRDADQAYANWTSDASNGHCTDLAQDSGIVQANQTAADAKRDFVARWNPIAERYGLKTYTWKEL